VGFTLLEKRGQGGMGVVWKALDDETGEIVALKVLHGAYSDDPEYLARFERELKVVERIHSAHVVKVLAYGRREGAPFIAFEYVDGPSLREALAEHGPYTWPETRGLLIELAEGLADAHATGVVHRDVKPSNVLLAADGTAKLADFGISHAVDLAPVTRASGLVGTPAYLAPEGPVDERSDLYSLGVMAFELMTGEPPFEGDSYQQVMLAHLREAPEISRLPEPARPVVGWLLEKSPADRPQSARQLVRVLTGAEPIRAGPGGTYGSRPDLGSPGIIAMAFGRSGAPAEAGPRGGARLRIVAEIGLIAVLAAGAYVITRPGPAAAPSPSPSPSVVAVVSPTVRPSATPVRLTGSGTWAAAGALPQTVWGQGAEQLADGRILLFGTGQKTSDSGSRSAWLFDPKTKSLTATGSMAKAQELPVTALLGDGSVLAAGGQRNGIPQATAQLYVPSTGKWQSLPNMAVARAQATATVLKDGRVLVAGGWSSYSNTTWTATRTAEIYDPATGSWTSAAPMQAARGLHTATLLADGRVLAVGGATAWAGGATNPANVDLGILADSEIYDPAADTWTEVAAPMSTARATQSAVLLATGHVLVVGGWGGRGHATLATVEDFDPATGAWHSDASLTTARGQTRLVTLADGRVMVIGGDTSDWYAIGSCELFDPSTGKWTMAAGLPEAVYWPAVAVLADGRVLVAGGSANLSTVGTIELYTPN
jgi:Protein kinase domain/Kelch motif/Galactose oxidase, central domain